MAEDHTDAASIPVRRGTDRADVRRHAPEAAFGELVVRPLLRHCDLAEAQAGARRKWTNLGRPQSGKNFGGQGGELWTPGGEASFVWRLVSESAALGAQVCWFTTLVSKSANLEGVMKGLERVKPAEVRTIEMSQGQKRSRIVAWTFLPSKNPSRV